MNAYTEIKPPDEAAIRPFNALAAYEAEREENRRLFGILRDVLMVADHAVSLAERAGHDVSAKKAILAKAREDRFEVAA